MVPILSASCRFLCVQVQVVFFAHIVFIEMSWHAGTCVDSNTGVRRNPSTNIMLQYSPFSLGQELLPRLLTMHESDFGFTLRNSSLFPRKFCWVLARYFFSCSSAPGSDCDTHGTLVVHWLLILMQGLHRRRRHCAARLPVRALSCVALLETLAGRRQEACNPGRAHVFGPCLLVANSSRQLRSRPCSCLEHS